MARKQAPGKAAQDVTAVVAPPEKPLFEIPILPHKLQEIVRGYLSQAYSELPLKRLMRLAARSGYPLESAESTLRQFIGGRGLDCAKDLRRLFTFFNCTPIGAILREPMAAGAGNDEFQCALVEAQLNPPLEMTGSYFVYHTVSSLIPLFSVSALDITASISGSFSFSEFLDDAYPLNDSPDPVTYTHSGIVLFGNKLPRFLSINLDQGLGVRTIICDNCDVHNGRPTLMFGRMLGVSSNGRSYMRHVLIERVSSAITQLRDRTKLTGFKNLTEHQKSNFTLLAQWSIAEPPKADFVAQLLDPKLRSAFENSARPEIPASGTGD